MAKRKKNNQQNTVDIPNILRVKKKSGIFIPESSLSFIQKQKKRSMKKTPFKLGKISDFGEDNLKRETAALADAERLDITQIICHPRIPQGKALFCSLDIYFP